MGLVASTISGSVDNVALSGSLLMADASGYANPSTIATSWTLISNYNYSLVGPITINNGVTLHIPGTANLKIL